MRTVKRTKSRLINGSLILGFIVILFSTGAGAAGDNVSIGIELKADNLTAPLALVPPGDDTGRLFVVDQIGVIKILMPNGTMLDTPFLDIRNKLVTLDTSYDERGLLGLAFHPNFKSNGRFYVYYSGPLRPGAPTGFDHTNYLAEYNISANDTNAADPASERILLMDDHPYPNHNAGQITFGPDGFLYVPIGDGGGANDVGIGHAPGGNGQNLSTIEGKILRIDVNRGNPYGIPSDNPFANSMTSNGTPALPEIYAYGFRNPFHISFDAGGNKSLFSQDAGQDLWEEVDIVQKGGDYGWNIKEGTHCFDPNNNKTSPLTCNSTGPRGEPLIDPIIEFANAKQPGGLSFVVIGGYVYRGNAMPELAGKYIFGGATRNLMAADGSLFIATPPSTGEGMWNMSEMVISNTSNGRINHIVRSFGQDENRELYVLASEMLGPTGNTGKVFKLVPPAPNVTATPTTTTVPTETATPNLTETPNVTETVTMTPMCTVTPTATGTVTANVTETATVTPICTVPTVTETVTGTVTPTVTETVMPNVTATVTANVTETALPNVTGTAIPTVTETMLPNVTATVTANVTETATPGVTTTVTAVPTGTAGPPAAIPEFPAIVLPVTAVLGLMVLLLYRRRDS